MTLAAILAVLVAHNLLVRERWYVPCCWATTSAVVLLAGASRHEIGLTAAGWPLGVAVGAVAASLVAVAAFVPATRPLFRDGRMAGVPARGMAWQAAVRIPVGTVLLEEVAFRGVLPVYVPAAVAAALFGLWHVRPTVRTLRTNGRRPSIPLLAAAVAVTATAGLAFHLLRVQGGGVLAPALVHAAITATATVASFLVVRSR